MLGRGILIVAERTVLIDALSSIRYAMDKHKNLGGLASDCVAFENAAGGKSYPPPCVSTRFLHIWVMQEPDANALRLMHGTEPVVDTFRNVSSNKTSSRLL